MIAVTDSRRRSGRPLRTTLLLTAFVPLLALTACAPAGPAPADPAPAARGSASAASGSASAATPVGPTATAAPEGGASTRDSDSVRGTVLRFRSDRTTVDVTVDEDNTTVRDLLGRLPLTVTAEEFAGREKIAAIPDGLETGGSQGSDPEDGDLIYYVPWGGFGFYYDASGIGYSDQTIHLGTYDASRQQLERLEGRVTVTRVG